MRPSPSIQFLLPRPTIQGRGPAVSIKSNSASWSTFWSDSTKKRAAAASDISQTDEALRVYARKAIALATCVIGVEVAGELRGVLELYAGGPASWAEVALVVEKSWRQRGLGWAMLSEAGRSADTAGTQTLRLIFSRHNWPMRKLASKAQARIDLDLDEICADIPASALPSAA